MIQCIRTYTYVLYVQLGIMQLITEQFETVQSIILALHLGQCDAIFQAFNNTAQHNFSRLEE